MIPYKFKMVSTPVVAKRKNLHSKRRVEPKQTLLNLYGPGLKNRSKQYNKEMKQKIKKTKVTNDELIQITRLNICTNIDENANVIENRDELILIAIKELAKRIGYTIV